MSKASTAQSAIGHRWSRISELLDAASVLPREKCEAFLADACGGDEVLRHEVKSLLEVAEPAEVFLAAPLVPAHPSLPAPAEPHPPDSSTLGGSRFSPGTLLAGRYRIINAIGRGGMGEVYRADDLKLGQKVALKLLPSVLEQDPEILQRFLDEARIAREIAHPNVCRVYDVGEAEGFHFLSMESITGGNLATLLKRVGRLPRGKAAELGHQLADGLAAVHQEGILHRDLKPANVMIDDQGRVRLTDFGIAGYADSFRGFEIQVGTPAYMAPEQLSGEGVSKQSDLYALGLVLFEIFTGRHPFQAGTSIELARQPREDPPPAPSSWVPLLDPRIEQTILSCLAKNPEHRPASASEVCAVFRQARVEVDPPGMREASGSIDSPVRWRPRAEAAIPRRPHWRLERKLGEDGVGEVWRARHRKTQECRVLVFRDSARQLEAARRRSPLPHVLGEELGERDDITRIVDSHHDEAPYFLEIEATDGGDLREWAERNGGLGQIPISRRLLMIRGIATALAAVHAAGRSHGDLQPSSLLIARGSEKEPRAVLTALGLVSQPEAGRLYRAPELLEEQPVSPQSDVYALGVLFYQVVIGDLDRALAPGWRKDVADELLAEDLHGLIERAPKNRITASQLVHRLQTLEARRAELVENRRKEHQEQERTQQRFAGRRWLIFSLLLVSVMALAAQWMLISHMEDAVDALTAAQITEGIEKEVQALEDSLLYMSWAVVGAGMLLVAVIRYVASFRTGSPSPHQDRD